MSKNSILNIEENAIYKVHDILSEHRIGGKILFVSDDFVYTLYGQIIEGQLQNLGKVKLEFIDSNTISFAMNIAERIIATDIDYIVGLGGGKVLDVCKYAAYISKIPFISIPTTMANDGLASPIAVLKRQDNKPKSLGCDMPDILIIDTFLIQNSPLQLIKAGIGDTISNYMALLDWELAVERDKDTMNGFAYLMSRTSLDALMNTQFDSIGPEFIKILANSLVLSGIAMNFSGSSRPVSGSEHLFSHALDYYCDTPNLHGIQVALGTVAVLKIIEKDYTSVLKYLKRFGVDINPQHLGISKSDFILCMQNAPAMRNNRYTYLHETQLNSNILSRVYDELLEEL